MHPTVCIQHTVRAVCSECQIQTTVTSSESEPKVLKKSVSHKGVTTKLDKLTVGCWVQIAVIIIALSLEKIMVFYSNISQTMTKTNHGLV